MWLLFRIWHARRWLLRAFLDALGVFVAETPAFSFQCHSPPSKMSTVQIYQFLIYKFLSSISLRFFQLIYFLLQIKMKQQKSASEAEKSTFSDTSFEWCEMMKKFRRKCWRSSHVLQLFSLNPKSHRKKFLFISFQSFWARIF